MQGILYEEPSVLKFAIIPLVMLFAGTGDWAKIVIIT